MFLAKKYRDEQAYETVNTVGVYIDNKWKYQDESVPLTQTIDRLDNAVVIGNGLSRNQFDLRLFLPYRETTPWGETGPWQPASKQIKNLNTYGCNAVYRNYKSDFLVAIGEEFIEEIAQTDYCDNNIVYANSKYLEKYPGKFNIIPQNPELNSGAVAVYLAAFDGHKKIYMLGFDGIDNTNDNYNVYANTQSYRSRDDLANESFWVRSLNDVMKVYSDTEFIRVCPTKNFRQPELWRYNLNYRQIDFRQFVLEADI